MYIASMTQFCHCKTTLDIIIFRGQQPFVVVALCSKKLDSTAPGIHKEIKETKCEKISNTTPYSTMF
jgi:hypothetical protein